MLKRLILRAAGVALAFSLFAVAADSQSPYSPPPGSAGALKGISFSTASPAGDNLRMRFQECDSKDTCQSKAIKYGCRKDQNRNTALLRLRGNVIFFDGKMGVDADGSPLSRNTPGQTDQPETSFRYKSAGHASV